MHLDTLITKMMMTGTAARRQTIAGNDMYLLRKETYVTAKFSRPLRNRKGQRLQRVFS